MLAAGGKLGASDAFKLAVPNADKATFALYADLDKLEPLYLSTVPKDQRGNVALYAVGRHQRHPGRGRQRHVHRAARGEVAPESP